MKSTRFIRPFVLAAVATLTTSTSLWALGPEGHTAEVSVGGGYEHLKPDNTNDTSANHGIVMASVSYNVTKFLSIGPEYTFTSLASETFSDGLGSATYTAHLHNYGGLVHIGLFNLHVAQPYLLIDGGGMNLTFNGNGNTTNNTHFFSLTNDHYGTYAGAGLGVNIYLGGGFGVRPEVRYSRQQLNDSTDNQGIFPGNGRNEVSATGQLFYTFGHRGR